MQFHKLVLSAILTIATAVGLPASTYAAPQYNRIAQEIGLKIARSQADQFQTDQPRLHAEDSAVNQAGQTFFNHPPQLIRAAASQTGEYVSSIYRFTLTIPQDAGQPLKAVTITQVENLETVKFNISNSKAFLGQRLTADSAIPLASVGGDQPSKPGEVTLVFDQSVQPGNTVTVALAVRRNPSRGGIYLFGVTAYPAGENGLGQFLGYGRISFDDNSD
jgi:hypothetical protein